LTLVCEEGGYLTRGEVGADAVAKGKDTCLFSDVKKEATSRKLELQGPPSHKFQESARVFQTPLLLAKLFD